VLLSRPRAFDLLCLRVRLVVSRNRTAPAPPLPRPVGGGRPPDPLPSSLSRHSRKEGYSYPCRLEPLSLTAPRLASGGGGREHADSVHADSVSVCHACTTQRGQLVGNTLVLRWWTRQRGTRSLAVSVLASRRLDKQVDNSGCAARPLASRALYVASVRGGRL
jgi:hypothetical protein